MIERRQTKQKLVKMLRVILIFAVAIAVCFLIGAGIGDDTVGNTELRLIGMHDNWLVILLEESGKLSAYYKDTSSADSTLTKASNVTETGCAFFQNGGSIGIAECIKDELHVRLYSLSKELILDGSCPFSFSPKEDDKLVFADVEPNIYTMYILSSDGNLRSCEVFSEPEDTAILSGVTFLDSTQGGWVYAYADGILRRWKGNGIESSEEYCDIPCPERLVGENVYIDDNGTLVKIKNGACQEYSLDIEGLNPRTCFGTDDYLIAADSAGLIHKYDWSGEDISEVGTAASDGEVWGLIENYVLTKKDDHLYLTQILFHDPDEGSEGQIDPTPTSGPSENEEPTPSPQTDPTDTPNDDDGSSGQEEATPTPAPPDKGDDEVGKLIEELGFKELAGENGKYVAMLAGARVADLRKIYKPQSIDAFTQDDKPVFESLLKTGMKIRIDGEQETISVVIRGDCDGDGRVAKSDITFASLYIINMVYAETDVQFVSMDMNDDGKVDIWDLPMIADETRRKR